MAGAAVQGRALWRQCRAGQGSVVAVQGTAGGGRALSS